MQITSYTSEVLNKVLLQEITYKIQLNNGIIPLINDTYLLNELMDSSNELITLKDLDLSGDAFIFDCFEEIFSVFKYKELYFSERYYKSNKNKFSDKLIQVLNRNLKTNQLFKEAYRVFLNKIQRCVHTSRIVYINIKFVNHDEDTSLEDTLNTYNKIMNNIRDAIVELSPGINIIDVDCIVKRIDGNLDFSIDKSVLDLITEELNKTKKIVGEKIFPSLYPIKYCYEKASIFNKEKLIIIFSAFSSDGAKYNYRNTLKFTDCNKLFILDDFGTRGSYYLGVNGNMEIESSVISLITYILSKSNIKFQDVITVGSSKGGTAALYYGLKYSFGNIIIGAPQYKVGSYLSDLSVKQYAHDIFGEINDINRVKYDNVIRMSCPGNSKSKIYMLTSEGDRQYKKVLRDFISVSNEFNLKLDIKMCDISNHAEIANEFPPYLTQKVKEILNKGCFDSTLTDRFLKKVTKIKNKIEKRSEKTWEY